MTFNQLPVGKLFLWGDVYTDYLNVKIGESSYAYMVYDGRVYTKHHCKLDNQVIEIQLSPLCLKNPIIPFSELKVRDKFVFVDGINLNEKTGALSYEFWDCVATGEYHLIPPADKHCFVVQHTGVTP